LTDVSEIFTAAVNRLHGARSRNSYLSQWLLKQAVHIVTTDFKGKKGRYTYDVWGLVRRHVEETACGREACVARRILTWTCRETSCEDSIR
jgi:hypothetical protein